VIPAHKLAMSNFVRGDPVPTDFKMESFLVLTETDQLLDIERVAIRLLAQNEHTVRQLRTKLRKKDYDAESIETVLEDLQRRNLLSDERFARQYLQMRSRKGFGPVRIEQEMYEKGVSDALISITLEEADIDWPELMQETLGKKYGSGPALNYDERARRARFLEYRGFPASLIRKTLFKD
jgi:regulatory protein